MLKRNFQQILDGEFLSNEIEQKSGVAQGDKLSSLIFSIFIADLNFELKCKALDVIFYADDLELGSHRQCQLQKNLNNLNTYCSRNYLKINVNKTQCIKTRRGGRLAVDEKFYISKREVEITNTLYHLGVIFSSRLSPSHHLKHLMNKAYQSVASKNQKLNLQKVSFNSAQQLFNSVVFPAPTYGIETYVDELFEIEIKHYQNIEAVFWKNWWGVSKYTSSTTRLNKLKFHDIHGLKDCPPKHRRVNVMFYASGLHNKCCCIECCYQWEMKPMCADFAEKLFYESTKFFIVVTF